MPFVIRADLHYSLLTSGLPHHVHVAHYGRPTVTRNGTTVHQHGALWWQDKEWYAPWCVAGRAPVVHGGYEVPPWQRGWRQGIAMAGYMVRELATVVVVRMGQGVGTAAGVGVVVSLCPALLEKKKKMMKMGQTHSRTY
jgi:hypothetical protein